MSFLPVLNRVNPLMPNSTFHIPRVYLPWVEWFFLLYLRVCSERLPPKCTLLGSQSFYLLSLIFPGWVHP